MSYSGFSGTFREAAGQFACLGEPKCLRIVMLLIDGEKTIEQLASAMEQDDMTGAPHHVAQLTFAGLIKFRREGRNCYYHLASKEMEAMIFCAVQVFGGPPSSAEAQSRVSADSSADLRA